MFTLFPVYVCTQRFTPKRRYIGNSFRSAPYIPRLKSRASDIRKVLACVQESFHEIMIFGTANRICGTMGKCVVFNTFTRSRKVDRRHLRTGGYSEIFEQNLSQQNHSRHSEVDTSKNVSASLFY